MCLIVYQPRGGTTPPELLRSAAEYNPDGFGFMGFGPQGKPRITRTEGSDPAVAEALALEFNGLECAFHFRYRTRGSSAAENLHPFRLAQGLYLMHNGTAHVDLRIAGRSDTWHLVNDYLAPLLANRRKLIYDRAFRRILDQWLGPQNRLVILDEGASHIELMNRADGFEWHGLWLSNTRWVDRRLLGLESDLTPGGTHRPDQVRFC